MTPAGRVPWALLLLAFPLLADTLVINGRVLDENGSPVAGTRVSVYQPQAIPARDLPQAGSTSDATGQFRFEIPAEGVFQVRADREGFFPLQMPSVSLRRENPLELRLNHLNELSESVTVRYATPVIDPEQTSDVKRLDSEQVLNVPTAASQDFRNSLPLIPSVVKDNGGVVHFNGGYPLQTNYRLNGFDISNPASGELTTRLNVDAIDVLEWEASRFSADKGKGSAGTLDLRTRMGDDHWRFGGTNFVPGLGTQAGAHLNHWSPRVMLSGPIRKSRAWFHDAFDLYYVADTVAGLPSGQNRAKSISGTNLTRLQWNVRENQILTGSFLINLENSRRNGLSFLRPVETTVNRRQSLLLGTIKDQFLIGGGLLEIGFANTSAYFRGSPQGTQPYTITPFSASGNFFRDDTQRSGRQEWLVNGFLKPMNRRGTHQIALGADIERSHLDEVVLRQELNVARVDGSLVRDVRFIGSPRREQSFLEVYGYARDKWNPAPDLTLDIGIRTQWDKYSGGAPPAPRLGVAWAPRLLRGTKVAGGWGLFYDPLSLKILALSQEQRSLSTFFSPAGLPLGLPVETRYIANPNNLRLARFAISSLSVERAFAGNVYGKVSLTSRSGSRGPVLVQNMFEPTRNDYVLSNVERQRYRAAEVSARGTLLAKYQWFASYTRSSARTNAVLAYSIENPLRALQTGGPLDWDAPNRVLAWGWIPVGRKWLPRPLQLLIGETDLQILTDYRTGFPFLVTTEAGRVVGRPNSRRFPDYFSVNIALERKFRFRGYLWAFRAGFINALDRQNSNVVNNDYDSPNFLTFYKGQPRAANVRLRFIGRK